MSTPVPVALLLLAACSPSPGGASDVAAPLTPDGTPPMCADGETYPADPADVMALGEVLYPYSWPVAIHRGTGVRTVLDLVNVPCGIDAEIDWSPFDVLLFVSLPAW